ncbi:UNVERIFIED_CONTAM: hypothetical protein NCL1_57834 [Trichonephila clavipes]
MSEEKRDLSLKDEPRSGRPLDVSNEELRKMIRTNPTLISTEGGLQAWNSSDNYFGLH